MQGRVAGENAAGGRREFAGSVGTQVLKVFDLAIARTGLNEREASRVGFNPLTAENEHDDHKAYCPGAYNCASASPEIGARGDFSERSS